MTKLRWVGWVLALGLGHAAWGDFIWNLDPALYLHGDLPVMPTTRLVEGRVTAYGRAFDQCLGSNNLAGAYGALQQMLALAPAAAPVLYRAAQFYTAYQPRQILWAEDFWAQLCALQPRDTASRARWGGVLFRCGYTRQARRMLDTLHARDPLEPMVRFNLGLVSAAQGNPRRARALLRGRSAREIGSMAAWLRDEQARFTALLGPDRFAAIVDYVLTDPAATNAPSAAPATADALTRRLQAAADLLWQACQAGDRQDWAAATNALGQARAAGVTAVGLDVEQARSQFNQGAHYDAVQRLKMLMGDHPSLGFLCTAVGDCYLRMGVYPKAEMYYTMAVDLDATEYPAVFGRACVMAATGRDAEAYRWLTTLAGQYHGLFARLLRMTRRLF